MFDIYSIIGLLRRTFTRKDCIIIFFIVGLYFASRIINIDGLPIFGDEGIYTRWAKVARADASWRFISLTDGKQPLQTWGTIPFLKLIDTPYIAARLFSVATGFFGLVGMFVTCLYLFGKRAAYIGAMLYVFTPYFLFYDRMALVDSAVNAFAIWIFLFSILLARTIRFDVALIFGLLSGCALLAKSSVRLFLGLGYFAMLLIVSTKSRVKTIVNFTALYAMVGFFAIVIYNIQRLSPFFHYVAEKNKTFIVTFDEFISTPFAYLFHNLRDIPYYVFSEMGYISGVLGIVGVVLLIKKDRALGLYTACWLLVPYIIIALVSKVIFPRYLIFFGSILTLSAAYLLSSVTTRARFIAIVITIAISVIYFDYTILFDQKNIPFPPVDRGQYVTGITAGWGIDELIAFSREKAREKKVILMAEGDFGVIGDQLDAHLTQNDNIFVKGYWPLNREHVIEIQKELKDNYVYVVFSHKESPPDDWPLRLMQEYKKPGGQASIFFAEVIK